VVIASTAQALRAQNASLYSFTASPGTFTPLSGGTNVSVIQDDDVLSGILPIGFTFNFCGTNYPKLKASSNGFVVFDTLSTASNATNSLVATPMAFALWDDLDGRAAGGSTATYQTSGTAPNRVFTMEWKNWEWNFSAANPVMTFQIKLYETSNVIEYVYQQEATAINTASGGASIGISNSTSSYLALTTASASPATSTTAFTNNILTKPATGQVYRFTPPPPCAAVPANIVVNGPPTICSGVTFPLTVNNLPGASGNSFQWEKSPDSLAWTVITGATTINYSTTQTVLTYYRVKVRCATTADSLYTPGFKVGMANTSFSPPVTTLPFSEDFETWQTRCNVNEVPSIYWKSNPTTGNNSWKREDEIIANSGWSGTSGAYNPVSSTGLHSARFHSFNATSGTQGTLDVKARFNSPLTKVILFDMINVDGTDSLVVEISADNGASWINLGSFNQSPTWTTKAVTTTLITDTAIVRFRGYSDWGNSDIGLDNVSIQAVSCLSPTAFTLQTVTNTSATFSWVCASNCNGTFSMLVGPKGFNPLGTTGFTTYPNLTSAATITSGLVQGVVYDAYVIQDCSGAGNGKSLPTGPITFALKPGNDDCANAVTLTPNTGTICIGGTDGTTVGATQSAPAAACGSTPDDDVWYKFVATSNTHKIRISAVGAKVGTSTDMYHQVFSGSCTSLAAIKCSDPDSSILTGLTVGDTYFFRVWSKDANTADSFKVCISTLTQPANDTCGGAITLTPSTTISCSGGVVGTTLGATLSPGAACGTLPADDDVWYKFVATSTVHKVTLSAVGNVFGSSKDMYHQVFGGACNGLTALKCSDPDSSIITGLTVGNTYFVRVWSKDTLTADTFKICIATLPAPVNDGCTTATILTPAAGQTCTSPLVGTTLGASQSAPTAACSGKPDDDVWYKFTATSTVHKVALSKVGNVFGSSKDMYHQVFGGNCTTLTPLTCNDPDSSLITGLTVGNDYFIRVWTVDTLTADTFTICLTTIQQPVNDTCLGAVTLTPTTSDVCMSGILGTTLGAFISQAPTPCIGKSDDDVWYKFVATAPSHKVKISGAKGVFGTSNDMYHQLLSGSCGTMTSVRCTDIDSSMYTGLTVGNTYYVRVWTVDTLTADTFRICIATIPQPANDSCQNATVLTPVASEYCTGTIVGSTYGASGSLNLPACAGKADDDVWYKFIATTASHKIKISAVGAKFGNSLNMHHEVFKGSSCGSLTSIKCVDPDSSMLTGLTVGDTYYIRVFTFDSLVADTFKICVATIQPPVNDECSGAVNITLATTENCTGGIVGTTLGASPSLGDTCVGVNKPDDDVWYKFTATSTSHKINITSVGSKFGSSNDMYHQVMTGSCGTLATLKCSDVDSNLLTGLAIGSTYFVRVWTKQPDVGDTFKICISTIAPVSNDSCQNATVLVPVATENCTGTVVGSTLGATASVGVPFCTGGGVPDDDVWYKFVATSSAHKIKISAVGAKFGTSTDMYHQVLKGTCGGFTTVGCTDPDSSLLSGLTVGDTYYIRVYSKDTLVADTFKICIATIQQPANDSCHNAVNLTPVTSDWCTGGTVGSTLGATRTAVAPPACASSGVAEDDVWYTFTATNPWHRVVITSVGAKFGTSKNLYHQVLTGSCGTFTSVACSDPDSSLLRSLTPGQQYYVRVWTVDTLVGDTFKICISTPPQPANDTCGGAITLVPATTENCTAGIKGTTYGASRSMNAAPCLGAPDDDVWYKFVATSTSHRINLTSVGAVVGTSTDMYHQVLTGSCTGFTSLKCSDPDSNLLSGLTVGDTYYIRVYTRDTLVADTFRICISTIATVPNDECTGAQPITLVTGENCTNGIVGTTLGATRSVQNFTQCTTSGVADDDVWYSFTATSTAHKVNINSVGSKFGTSKDMYHQVLTGPCGALSSVKCSDPDSSLVTGLTVGQLYYIRIWTKDTLVADTFKLCVSTIPTVPNDSCQNATQLTVSPNTSCANAMAGTTLGATASNAFWTPCVAGSVADDDVWYKFTATSSVHFIKLFDVGAKYGNVVNMDMQLYTNGCSSLGTIKCSDPDSFIVTGLATGQNYYLRAWTKANDVADSFKVCVAAMTPPVNDGCASASTVTCGNTYTGSTVTADLDGMGLCVSVPAQTAPGVWYKYTGTGDSVVFSTCDVATNFDTRMNVYVGSCNNLSCLRSNDNAASCGAAPNSSEVSFVAAAGTDYYILVHGATDKTGAFKLKVTCSPCVKPTVNAGVDTLICPGSSYTMTAVGNASNYKWSSNATNGATSTISAPGTYTVTATSASGCINTDNVVIGTAPLPNVNAGNDTSICLGQPATLRVTTNGTNIVWSTGATTPTITVNTAGTYIVSARNQYGCRAYDTVEVMLENNPVVNLGPDVNECPGVPVVLNAGFPGFIYQWSNGATTQTTAVLQAGTYWVNVSNARGCFVSDTINVTHKPLPEAGFEFTSNGTSFNFTDTSHNSNTWWWTFGDNGTSNLQNPSHTYTQYGTYKVTLVTTNICGNDTAFTYLGIYPTGVAEVSSPEDQLKVYPNPSSGSFFIANPGGADIRKVTVTNALGAEVYAQEHTGVQKQVQVQLRNFAGGNYQVTIFTDKGRVTKQLKVIAP
jgi:hypothetical protein